MKPIEIAPKALPPEAAAAIVAAYGKPLSEMALYEIGNLIALNWPKVSPYAAPYLDAMCSLGSINDNYYCDSGASVVAYFLANAGSFKGPIAKAVKVELKKLLDGYYAK